MCHPALKLCLIMKLMREMKGLRWNVIVAPSFNRNAFRVFVIEIERTCTDRCPDLKCYFHGLMLSCNLPTFVPNSLDSLLSNVPCWCIGEKRNETKWNESLIHLRNHLFISFYSIAVNIASITLNLSWLHCCWSDFVDSLMNRLDSQHLCQ